MRFSTNIPDGQFHHTECQNKLNNLKRWKCFVLDGDLKISFLVFINIIHYFAEYLLWHFFFCLWTFCLSFYEAQCRVGLGHRGFSNGVGGLFFAALSSKSCLSVLSSWTSCNNINGPLNSLLCCAALAWVTSHTWTLSRSEMHAYCQGMVATLLAHKSLPKIMRSHAHSGRWMATHATLHCRSERHKAVGICA